MRALLNTPGGGNASTPGHTRSGEASAAARSLLWRDADPGLVVSIAYSVHDVREDVTPPLNRKCFPVPKAQVDNQERGEREQLLALLAIPAHHVARIDIELSRCIKVPTHVRIRISHEATESHRLREALFICLILPARHRPHDVCNAVFSGPLCK